VKLYNQASVKKAVMDGIAKVRAIDSEHVWDYLDKCMGGVAAYRATGNLEYGKVDDLDYWEAQTDSFEAGLKVGAAAGPDGKVFIAYLDPDDDGIATNLCFYFVGGDAKSVVKELRGATSKWIEGLRKEKGLFPFKD